MRGEIEDGLTGREQEVRRLLDRGLTNQEIADRLGISVPGVKYHVSQILSKLGVESRREVGARRDWLAVVWRVALAVGVIAAIAGVIALVAILIADGSEDEATVALPSESAQPTPSDTPSPTPSATGGPQAGGRNPSGYALHYFVGGDLFVAEPGEEARQLPDIEGCRAFSRLIWSPRGDRVVCVGEPTVLLDRELNTVQTWQETARNIEWSSTGDAFAVITDDQRLSVRSGDGSPLAELGTTDLRPGGVVSSGRSRLWSPDGDEIAYWDEDEAQLRIYSVESASERPMGAGLRLLAWLTGDTLLVTPNYVPSTDLRLDYYEVHAMSTATGETRRLEFLEATADGPVRPNLQAWLSPQGDKAVVLITREDGFSGLGIVELASGSLTRIPDSRIGFQSDSIPPDNVRWSFDGETLYWVDMSGPTTIYRAPADGTGLTRLAELTLFARLSPDAQWVTYPMADIEQDASLYIASVDGSVRQVIDRREIVDRMPVNYSFFWRPNLSSTP